MEIEVNYATGQKPPQLPPGDRFQGHLLRQLVETSQRAATAVNQSEVRDVHLLCALVEHADPATRGLLDRCGLKLDVLQAELAKAARDDAILIDRPVVSAEACNSLQAAISEAEEQGLSAAGTQHVLLAILGSVTITEMLHRLHVAVERLKAEMRTRVVPRLKKTEKTDQEA